MRMETSNEALAKAASDGDRAAFSQLLCSNYDRLFSLAFRLTGSRAEAEDLTQDVCLALPDKLKGFEGTARFTTWLYRVVVNAAHDRRRRQATYARAASNWGEVEVARFAENADQKEATDWLNTAMSRLNPDLRDTLALIIDDELTHAEAGEVLGISEGTVSWRLSKARKTLRALHETEQQI